jgi:hypothetical protein
MANTRKGFTRERHSPLKLAMAASAVVGFAAAWAGFSRSHGATAVVTSQEAVLQASTAPPPATATPAPISTPSAPSPIPTRTVEPTPTPATPVPTATRRRTRAS